MSHPHPDLPPVGLPVGPPVASHPATRPVEVRLDGRYVTLAPLDLAHADALYASSHGPEREALWAYLADGPFASRDAFAESLAAKVASPDPLFCGFVDRETGSPGGYAAYLRIEPVHRVIEVGHILFVPSFQRTRAATEAMYLMARHALEDLGYRRYEWKCNALNEPSRKAALRLGFNFEGTFRQHMIVKGRSRNTAWFSVIDREWPRVRAAFEQWLAPENFDEAGKQKRKLEDIRNSLRNVSD
jgi:RimJ/RimL family protein N-acetyltransferase